MPIIMMRGFRRLQSLGWPGYRPSAGVAALGFGAALAVVLIPVAVAQSRRPPSDLQTAARAFNEGRYEEAAGVLQKLDQRDPAVAALLARTLVARGSYPEAEAALRPAVERGPASEAALELGLLLQMLRRPEAETHLNRVAATVRTADDPFELARAARALRALGQAQEANSVYRDAVSLASRDPGINTGWGELALEKYQNGDALKSFKMALLVDPRYVPALLGTARALADDNPPEAVANAQAALKVNPNSADAYVFLAGKAADAGKRDEAKTALEKALAINPSSLDAHALAAGIAYVEDRQADYEAEVAKVLAIAPKYGDVYRVAGELAASNYRFDEAAALTRRAVALEPQSARALADLGIHLLRTGDEPGARSALEASFKVDPYNVVTYNLLQMMDTLDTFVTSKDGDIILKMHKDEAPLLQEYALSLGKQALAALSKRYGFTPQGPILVEVFPKHDDFAVRNVGLPGMIGALGACFGRVVTMDSPRARPPGEFQWEATLWHELAHVITLQMSKQRVPRWLTEGISVYEESLARPEWGRGQDVQFAQMLNEGTTLKLRDLNSGFTDPRMISMAYFQASLLVEHIVATFGDEGLHKLLRAYGEGQDTETALKGALNTDFDQLQGGFDQMLDRKFGAMRRALAPPEKGVELQKMAIPALTAYVSEHPESFPAHMVLGSALRKTGAADEAIGVLEKAASLVPMATGPSGPSAQIAQIALEKKDPARAIVALRDVVKHDYDNVDAARQLGELLRDSGVSDPAELEPVYRRIVAIDPFDQAAHASLGRFAMQRRDFETASREFRAVLALSPVDQAAAHTDLAESYFQGGERAEARRQTLAALEIAPSYERAQELLLKLAEDRR
jgi:tetratricopeptide (TPR) repeat protein